VLGPGIPPLGEIRTGQQIYAKQLAATISLLLGATFESPHKIGKPVTFASFPGNSYAGK